MGIFVILRWRWIGIGNFKWSCGDDSRAGVSRNPSQISDFGAYDSSPDTSSTWSSTSPGTSWDNISSSFILFWWNGAREYVSSSGIELLRGLMPNWALKDVDRRRPICIPVFEREDCGREEGLSIMGISTAVWRPLVPIAVRVAGIAIRGTVPGRRAVGIV